MNQQEMLDMMEEIMDLDPGTLRMDSMLSEFDEWDSLSVLSLIAAAKRRCNILLTGKDIQTFQTVEDVFHALRA